MSEPGKEVPAEATNSPQTLPTAIQFIDSSALEELDLEDKSTRANKGKNTKGRHSQGDPETELKKLAQRRINVAGAPKMPLNGYVRFMNDRREELRREQPHRTALEHTKIIGEEWHQLPDERKMPYMEAAAKDKAIYQEQLQMFLKEHPEIVAKELAKAKKATKLDGTPKEKAQRSGVPDPSSVKGKKTKLKPTRAKRLSEDPDDVPLAQVKRTPTPPLGLIAQAPPAPSSQYVTQSPAITVRPLQSSEIPIYTNEFIEHNRSTENELRTLRKAKTDLDQQNAVLEQHVDNTKAGYAKVMGEVSELLEEKVRLESYQQALRQKLLTALAGLPLSPLEPTDLSVDNIDKYIRHLASLSSQPNNGTLLRARESLRKLDINSLIKPYAPL
ncbi:hypothetical protein KR009_006592 [Drosophila setifemur]|nr:hypothetical protein KR009_006592 [Drosophila setifemur]